MKKYFMMAVAAVMFAACSNSDEELMSLPTQDPVVSGQTPVAFDVYTSRALKRAGATGDLTTDLLGTVPANEEAAKTAGFGVFGFYTDNNTYDGLTSPNFMYNQHVYAKTSANTFEYAPVKYWPNEYGSNAVSDDVDKVSFFAYAPYVEVTPTSGKVTGDANSGIVGLTRNSATGDPQVKYVTDLNPTNSVDLCWGVCSADYWDAIDGSQEMEAGRPWLDVKRARDASGQKMTFSFKHALAKLNVQIDAFVDGVDNTNGVASGTKIYVRSISFQGFALKGALNLNNTTPDMPLWQAFSGNGDLETGEEVTIYDGRKDGKEGVAVATNEKVTGLNPDLIQNTLWDSGDAKPGVTKDAVNLFNSATETAPVFVIPTGEPMKVTIVYDVETADANLSTYLSDGKQTGSSIENRITKDISFGGENIAAGKAYTLNLHLGMNSVKFDAEVVEWGALTESNASLPTNALAAGGTYTFNVAADYTGGSFIIGNLTPGSVQTPALEVTDPVGSGTPTVAYTGGAAAVAADGLATFTVASMTANAGGAPLVNKFTITSNDATPVVTTINIVQAVPAP